MKAYFEKNGKTRENKPRLNLPIQVLTLDDTKKVWTKDILSPDDLRTLWELCKKSKKEDSDKKRD
jgi:hypothetical protein